MRAPSSFEARLRRAPQDDGLEHRDSMPGSGTDKTKPGPDIGGPFVVLVEPQLGQNIGTVARAMANFGLSRLRLVRPRDGWANIQAQRAAAGADAGLAAARPVWP